MARLTTSQATSSDTSRDQTADSSSRAFLNDCRASTAHRRRTCASSAGRLLSNSWLAPLQTTTLASKGRLILCTVPGLIPNCSAILRTPGRLGVPSTAFTLASSSFSMVAGWFGEMRQQRCTNLYQSK